MRKVAFYTLGCKVNQYETEAITELFQNAGYRIVDFEEKADVYVINTCTVTSMSDRKSRQIIRRAKKVNSDSVVIVIGCYAQVAPEEVGSIEGVSLVIGSKDKSRIIEYLNEFEGTKASASYVDNIMNTREFERLDIETYKEHTRAFMKIQDGCNQFCSYCIIPYARGPIRSKSPHDILSEAERLARSGFKEIVLTGIHIASYGKDTGDSSLMDIIKRVHGIEGLERIRLGSIEPNTITVEFVRVLEELDKLCPHFHVSLQSGCDETLKRMNRKYTTADYKKAIDMLREYDRDVAITTDVMTGFPGESEEEFEATYKFLSDISFAKMHVFKYSPRKGTPAASFKGQVPPEVKDERSRRLIELSNEGSIGFNRQYLGRTMPVLFEQEAEEDKGLIEGLTTNYIRVICKGDKALKGSILDVYMEEARGDFVLGRIITSKHE